MSGRGRGPATTPRRPEDVSHHRARLAGVELHDLREGRVAPLVLIHGGSGFCWERHRNIGPLAEHFDVVADPIARGTWTDLVARWYNDYTIEYVAGAGHFPTRERPDRINRCPVESFLGRGDIEAIDGRNRCHDLRTRRRSSPGARAASAGPRAGASRVRARTCSWSISTRRRSSGRETRSASTP